MPKRKREDGEANIDRIKDQAVRIKASRLKARFDQGVLQLTQALKLARGFDRRKMTRRIQQAGSDTSKVDRLKAEIEVLNGLQESKVAKKYLLKQCARTKRIAEADAFVALFGGSEKVEELLRKDGSVGVVEGNVMGRLMKSAPVSEALPGIMKGIREVLGVDREKVVNGNATHGTHPVRSEHEATEDDEDADFNGFSDDPNEGADGLRPEGGSSQQIPNEESEDANESQDDELLEAYNHRLAASSDSESDRDETDGQNHDRLDDMQITSDEDQDNVSLNSLSDAEPDSTPHDVSGSSKAPPRPTSTSFLPSLMHGGYYSGSEGDDSNDDGAVRHYDPDKSFAAAQAQPRKNRRGQRERQSIAEKKYGSRANHLLKAKGAENVHAARQGLVSGGGRDANASRDQGWDARRGAVESGGRDRGRGKVRPNQAKPPSTRPPNRYERRHGGLSKHKSTPTSTNTSGARPQTNGTQYGNGSGNGNGASQTAKLHPSWEAARRRKTESANAGARAFAGTKITFD